ncbi:phospholipase A [Lysobacter koreensis]|uniref:Phospholipase A1 n=1 Tax=Lysobacter koreensis TaxID=266122 RepID=A0ABW2YJ10_9GAMM
MSLPLSWCAAAWLLPAAAFAQQAGPDAATTEACVAITVDADRLACYDTALGRKASDPKAADSAAREAKATKEVIAGYEQLELEALPPRERVQRKVGDLFRSEDGPDVFDARIANAGKGSLLDSRWELAKDSKLGVFNFRAYKPVYLLPAFWSSDPNEQPASSNPAVPPVAQSLSDVEAKFQLSFKTKAVENLFGDNGDIWMGYTQSSRWQVYNGDQSRPFRETNYEPEVLLVFRNNYRLGGWNGRMLGVGINHQSNGRADPASRSWNRVIANIGLDREDWSLMLRPWYRISDGNEDENPDIEDYVGRGDMTLVHRRGGHEFALLARHSLRGGERSRGAVQFDWGFPIHNTLRGHVQVFDGYGESLIDYDHRATYVGLGISLLEWY